MDKNLSTPAKMLRPHSAFSGLFDTIFQKVKTYKFNVFLKAFIFTVPNELSLEILLFIEIVFL